METMSPDRFVALQGPVVADMDDYIAKKCPDPDRKFYDMGTGNVLLSINDIRHHIATASTLGKELMPVWLEIMESRTGSTTSKEIEEN